MEKQDKKREVSSKVIVAGAEFEKYIFAIGKRLQPYNYEKNGEVVIQATEKHLPKAEKLVSFFEGLGCEVKSKKKVKTEGYDKSTGETYPLNPIQIILLKHPKIR